MPVDDTVVTSQVARLTSPIPQIETRQGSVASTNSLSSSENLHPVHYTTTSIVSENAAASPNEPTRNEPTPHGVSKRTSHGNISSQYQLTCPQSSTAGVTLSAMMPGCNSVSTHVSNLFVPNRGNFAVQNRISPSNGTAVPPNGTAVPPSGTAVPPNGTAVPPNGTVVPPNGTAVPPSGTVVPPSGTVVPPSGTVVPPNGTAVSPSGTAVPPNGTAVPPNGTAVPPNGTVVPPNGTAVSPSGTAVPPNGTVVPPSGTAVPPSGTAVPPNGTAVSPSGTAVPPNGTVVPPNGTAVPPNGTAVPPSGTAVPPSGTAGSKKHVSMVSNVNEAVPHPHQVSDQYSQMPNDPPTWSANALKGYDGLVPWEHTVCSKCLAFSPFSVWLTKVHCFKPHNPTHQEATPTTVTIDHATMSMVPIRLPPTSYRSKYVMCRVPGKCGLLGSCPCAHSVVELKTWKIKRRIQGENNTINCSLLILENGMTKCGTRTMTLRGGDVKLLLLLDGMTQFVASNSPNSISSDGNVCLL